jgi:phosphohistidine phosphatase
MELILWRHAEAEMGGAGQSDAERALTPRGEQQAQRMGRWLDARLPASTRVLVSPAVRAQQTARALGRELATVDALASGASVAALLAAAGWPQSGVPVLVVGHQPTLGLAVARLVAGVDQHWSVKKGAVWWLRGEREGAGQILAVQGPQGLP